MDTDDAAFKNFQRRYGIHTGTRPVPDIGADAETRITVFHEREHVVGIPQFVVRLFGALRMAMNASGDAVFFDELLDQINLVGGRLNGDGACAELLRELKNT